MGAQQLLTCLEVRVRVRIRVLALTPTLTRFEREEPPPRRGGLERAHEHGVPG